MFYRYLKLSFNDYAAIYIFIDFLCQTHTRKSVSAIISPCMPAFFALEELGLRFIRSTGLHSPIIGFLMAAFGTFSISNRMRLNLLIDYWNLFCGLQLFFEVWWLHFLVTVSTGTPEHLLSFFLFWE